MKKIVLFLALIVVNLSLFAKGGGCGHASTSHSSVSTHPSIVEHSSVSTHPSIVEHSSTHPSIVEHSMEYETPYHNFHNYSSNLIYVSNNMYNYRIYNDVTKKYDIISDSTENGLKSKLDTIIKPKENLTIVNNLVVFMLLIIVLLIIIGFVLN